MRLALLGTLGETDVIRNGTDVWIWRSRDNTAEHQLTLPAGTDDKPAPLASGVPSTPQEAADAALAAIDPTTAVTTTGAATVAGRDAYELVLAPKDTASLIGQVRLAIDAKEHIPLRVEVYAKDANDPAIRVAFQQISFDRAGRRAVHLQPAAGHQGERGVGRRRWRRRPDQPRARPQAGRRPAADAASRRSSARAGPSVLVAKLPSGDAGAKTGADGRGAARGALDRQPAEGQRHLGQRARCSPARCSARCSPTTAGSWSARSPRRSCTRPPGK